MADNRDALGQPTHCAYSVSQLDAIRVLLLQGKTWRYLRYLHFRNAVQRVVGEIDTICVCGGGHGLAELAVAIEFPNLKIVLTDIIARGYPNYHRSMELAWRNQIDNLSFSVWNVLEPTQRRFDLVASTEMLEHISDAPKAVKHMRAAATKYVYCLVPFSDDKTNNNLQRREQVWVQNEHQVYGYDRRSLESLFGTGEYIEGAYWKGAGMKLRADLERMSNEQIASSYKSLVGDASLDSRSEVPTKLSDALGISILARANAIVPAVPILPPPLARLREMQRAVA